MNKYSNTLFMVRNVFMLALPAYLHNNKKMNRMEIKSWSIREMWIWGIKAAERKSFSVYACLSKSVNQKTF